MASLTTSIVPATCVLLVVLAVSAEVHDNYAQIEDILRDLGGQEDKRGAEFSPWGGKRAFQPWGGKRSDEEVAKRAWQTQTSEDYVRALIKKGFQPWGGKRATFQPWGGKRAVDNDDLLAQRTYQQVEENDDDKRASFQPWGGKRAFQPWGGKRATFQPWGGKRAFQPWGGKRAFQPWGGKRAFQPWGGKRSESWESSADNLST